MKKFFCTLLAAVFLTSVFSVLTFAAETVPLTKMYDFGEIDCLEAEIDWFTAGRHTILHRHPGEETMRFFLSFFTDEKLVPMQSEFIENDFPAQTDSYFTISLLGENGVTNGYIYFDNEKIKLDVFGPESFDDIHSPRKHWEGWFTFKDANAYAEIEARWTALLATDDTNREEAVEDSQKNKSTVSDLKILYAATYDCPISETFSWGVCSFVREGEKAPVTAFFMKILGQSAWTEGTKKVVFLAESVSENNTLTFKTDRVLNFVVGDSVGKEYDRNFTTTAFFKAQMTVNASGQLTAIYLTLHADDTPHLVADEGVVDLSTLSHEYGTFPSHLFSVNAVNTESTDSKEVANDPGTAEKAETAPEKPTENTSEETEEKTDTKNEPEDAETKADTTPAEDSEIDTADENIDTTQKSEPEEVPADGDAVDKENIIFLEIGKKEAVVFGRNVTNDVAPKLVNDRTMLPIRFVAEALGGTVLWDEENRRVSITKENIHIEITIGSSMALVSGTQEFLDSPAFIENDRTYLPLRFVTENLGVQDIIWDEVTYSITIIA
ncbi:MAG: copper amine oxidase N-terminal domain-containing protein [Clostridia bacterium]|nr:copper amine oxidase N-terminal domain-containing protein [Clostridia bacterium]